MLGSNDARYELFAVLEMAVGRIKNIGPREAEKYFLRLPLLNEAGTTSFSALALQDDFQYPYFLRHAALWAWLLMMLNG